MTKKPITAKELIKILREVPPNTIIATSDYDGVEYTLGKPTATFVKKGESIDKLVFWVDNGGNFVDEWKRFRKDTLYIGKEH